ncbi:hypothetical protein [Saccharomonospora xinjiangensis]|uniref:Uncharacterized protein n=1 Tax=Saccharomonospora xinjiangensis XJ-54 TaxID=882086 RepID=I0UXC4_9PSEU|nr:hypothetical protein [Saccharomonospora xinjiangensis]EID52527.1 hypothetical protein SacxiDRAFT_0245 [Saccharomonospora xinjiangensis XJ-54]
MDEFAVLRELFADEPATVHELRAAWERARSLFATVHDKYESGVLRDELNRHATTANEALLLELVRETLAREGLTDDVVAAVFTAQEWDNGCFLNEHARVVRRDGARIRFDFGEAVEDVLIEEYGPVGRDAAVGVDLRSGTMTFDIDASNVFARIAATNS